MIKIEVGKKYIDGMGNVVGPMRDYHLNSICKFVGNHSSFGGDDHNYTEDGFFFHNKRPDLMNLVEEVVEEIPREEIPFPTDKDCEKQPPSEEDLAEMQNFRVKELARELFPIMVPIDYQYGPERIAKNCRVFAEAFYAEFK